MNVSQKRVARPGWAHCIICTFLLLAIPLSAKEISVSPDGPVTNLTQGVQLAVAGDTIIVNGGVYPEDSIYIDKPLVIIGLPGAVIDGAGKGEIIIVTSDSVTITGLTISNSSTSFIYDYAAVRLAKVNYCSITNNRFLGNFFAIYVEQSSECLIAGNDISSTRESEAASGNGIHLWYCRNMEVRNNRITGHRDGIYFEFVEDSEVKENVSVANIRYGLHFMFSDNCRYIANEFLRNGAGVAVMYSRNVMMIDNRFIENWGSSSYGLLLKDITDSEIRDNLFYRNSISLYSEGSNRLLITGCKFDQNGWAIKIMANSLDNVITGNDFTGNSFDVATNSRFTSSSFDGNYWSAYRGYDLDRDGTGDIPHYPVRLFSLIVEKQPPALVLLRSLLVDLLDLAELALPALTPDGLRDNSPRMTPIS